jgi:hypothetical protein
MWCLHVTDNTKALHRVFMYANSWNPPAICRSKINHITLDVLFQRRESMLGSYFHFAANLCISKCWSSCFYPALCGSHEMCQVGVWHFPTFFLPTNYVLLLLFLSITGVSNFSNYKAGCESWGLGSLTLLYRVALQWTPLHSAAVHCEPRPCCCTVSPLPHGHTPTSR